MRDSPSILHHPPALPLSRREALLCAGGLLTLPGVRELGRRPKRVAGIATVYTHNSHADVILSRLLQGENLDFRSRRPDLELVSLYVDQFPTNDLSRQFAKDY